MTRIRPHRATVVAYLALLIAMGGTATAATYVVSSNSQLGPGTVSGSRSTTGKHDNIIDGTIGGADLHAGAVGSSQLADNGVTGADVNESSLGTVPNAGHLGTHLPAYYAHVVPLTFTAPDEPADNWSWHSLGTVKGLVIEAECHHTLDTNSHTVEISFSSGATSSVNLFHVYSDDTALNKGLALTSSGIRVTDFSDETLGYPKYFRIEGQAIYHRDADGAVVVVAYHLLAQGCQVFGTATTTG